MYLYYVISYKVHFVPASLVLLVAQVIEISNVTKEGFDYGFMLIEGFGRFSGKTVKVIFQNENAIAYDATDGGSDATKENVIVTTPDVIAGTVPTIYPVFWHSVLLLYLIVLDPENGEAISNEDVRHGVKVAVVALEANPLLLTEEALKIVGPRAYGYEFDYVPFNCNSTSSQ